MKVFSISVVPPADEAVNTATRLITYYSDWHRLRKVVAWILKIKDVLREAYKKRKEGHTERKKNKWQNNTVCGEPAECRKGHDSVLSINGIQR